MLDRITINPGILKGRPCIRDLGLTVSRVVEAVALHSSFGEIQAEYPELEEEDIRQALIFAARNLDTQVIKREAV